MCAEERSYVNVYGRRKGGNKKEIKRKVGAIVGAVLGLISSYIPLLWWYGGGKIVTFIPPTPSLYSFGVYCGLFLSAMFGALIGATVGFVIDKYRRRR